MRFEHCAHNIIHLTFHKAQMNKGPTCYRDLFIGFNNFLYIHVVTTIVCTNVRVLFIAPTLWMIKIC
jgi:hypothetical protein